MALAQGYTDLIYPGLNDGNIIVRSEAVKWEIRLSESIVGDEIPYFYGCINLLLTLEQTSG